MAQKKITGVQIDQTTFDLAGANLTPSSVAATGTVTGSNLSGTNTGDQTITLTGDVTGSGTGSFATTLANTAVTPGSYTNANITVDSKGRITAASNGSGGGGSGTVTSIDITGANGVTSSGGPVTTSGSITVGLGAITPTSVAATGTVTGSNLSGTNTGDQTITLTGDVTGSGTGSFATTLATVGPTKGGTGLTTYTTGDILYASATNTLSKLGIGTNGQVLTVASGLPSWAAASGGGTSYTLQPVRVATTANITLSGTQTIDGVAVVAGNRVLVKNQSTTTQNGIYVVASGAWTRATDFDTGAATLVGGIIVPVQEGTVAAGSTYQCMNTSTAITIGSTAITFNRSSSGSAKGGNVAMIGNNAQVTGGAGAVAIHGTVDHTSGIAIGNSSSSTGGSATAGNVAIANSTSATGEGSVAIGHGASSQGGIAIGGQTASGLAAASSTSSGIAIGRGNSSGGNTTSSGGIAIGFGQQSSSSGVSIGLNTNSTKTAGSNAVQIGIQTGASGSQSIALGAFGTASQAGSVAIGSYATVQWPSQFSLNSSGFAAAGDIVSGLATLYIRTTDATTTELKAGDGNLSLTPAGVIALSNNAGYIFDCDIIARANATGDSSMWNLKFAIKRGANAASTTLLGSPTATLIAQDAGASAWTVAVTADTTNGRPNISVTGAAATTIRWVCNIRMTKVSG